MHALPIVASPALHHTWCLVQDLCCVQGGSWTGQSGHHMSLCILYQLYIDAVCTAIPDLSEWAPHALDLAYRCEENLWTRPGPFIWPIGPVELDIPSLKNSLLILKNALLNLTSLFDVIANIHFPVLSAPFNNSPVLVENWLILNRSFSFLLVFHYSSLLNQISISYSNNLLYEQSNHCELEVAYEKGTKST